MSEKKTMLKTGDKQLDADLKELFEFGSKRLNTIKKAVADKEISSEDFSKIVPISLIRLSSTFSGPRFNLLLGEINKDSIPLVKEAKSLIDKYFGDLFENEVAKYILKKEIGERDAHEESLADKSISGVGYYRVWVGSPPKLTPAVQMGFKNKKGKILWDVTLDWDDLSFLLEVLTRVLDSVLDKGKSLAENEQIDLSDSKTIGERIRKTLETFENIKKLAPTYKIKIKAGTGSKKKQKTKKKKRRN